MATKAALENHGRHIFLYHHIQTNQVVYSLTRALKNNDALRQLPFVGKKTVPAALRKDLWMPFATVTFDSNYLGLRTFQKLREFRMLHETQYPEEKMAEKKSLRQKYIMNQKANSIADLAASLNIEIARLRELKGEEEKGKSGDAPAQKRKNRRQKGLKIEDVNAGNVVVRWKNLLDAEYAPGWPSEVIHGNQARPERYSAGNPERESPLEVVE